MIPFILLLFAFTFSSRKWLYSFKTELPLFFAFFLDFYRSFDSVRLPIIAHFLIRLFNFSPFFNTFFLRYISLLVSAFWRLLYLQKPYFAKGNANAMTTNNDAFFSDHFIRAISKSFTKPKGIQWLWTERLLNNIYFCLPLRSSSGKRTLKSTVHFIFVIFPLGSFCSWISFICFTFL